MRGLGAGRQSIRTRSDHTIRSIVRPPSRTSRPKPSTTTDCPKPPLSKEGSEKEQTRQGKQDSFVACIRHLLSEQRTQHPRAEDDAGPELKGEKRPRERRDSEISAGPPRLPGQREAIEARRPG